jgi:hypothetical protein
MANPRGTPENLKPWPKGVSGIPRGRPPVRRQAAQLAAALDLVEGGNDRLRELAEGEAGRMVAAALLRLAIGGNFHAIREVFDRVDGPV